MRIRWSTNRFQEIKYFYQVHNETACYLSHGDVPELRGEGEHSEELDLTQRGLQQLVVGLDTVMGDVEVTGNTAQVCHLHKRNKHSHILQFQGYQTTILGPVHV